MKHEFLVEDHIYNCGNIKENIFIEEQNFIDSHKIKGVDILESLLLE